MNQVNTLPEVLTLDEAATYLRLSRETVKELAVQGNLPGRRAKQQWRFLKAALDDWLRGREKPDSRTALLEIAGVFKDDETLLPMLKDIYKARGRPEVEEGPDA